MEPVKYSLTEKVYRQIKELIIYGHVQPGESLNVNEIAQRFQVSKTPVREAFNALKHEGLVEILPYKGCLVSRMNLKDLQELFDLRALLEGAAAEMAALHATDKKLARLEALVCTDLNDTEEKDPIFFMKLNFDFHVAVAEAGNNDQLRKILVNIMDPLQRVLYLDLNIGSTHSMINEHRQLVDLIRKRDAAGAKALMIEHIRDARNRIFAVDFK